MSDASPPYPADHRAAGNDSEYRSDSDDLRSEVVRLGVELDRVQQELEHALDREAVAVAGHREAWLEAAEIRRSPSWRLTRPLRLKPPSRTRRTGPAPTEPGLARVSLSALRADLDGGWPIAARWRGGVMVPGSKASVLEQPEGSTIRYRVLLPAVARIRTAVTLPARVWREAQAGARATLRVRDRLTGDVIEQTARLVSATDHGPWRAESLELVLERGGDLVLELEVRSDPGTPPVPHVLWVAPEMVFDSAPHPELGSSALEPGSSRAVAQPPLISILTPVRDPAPRLLETLLDRVRAQTYDNWELCLADDGSVDEQVRALLQEAAGSDPRIHLERMPEPGGISAATNRALGLARGDFIALVDHDDLLARDALQVVADAVAADPTVDVLYSDEDHITLFDQRFRPYRKPQWSPDAMRSQMYTGHLSVLRRELVIDVGGFRSAFDGSQDYDLFLRVSERTDRIRRLARVLYHWRVIPQSASFGSEAKPHAYGAARRAIQEHIDRLGIRGSVVHGVVTGTYRILYEIDLETSVDVVLAVEPTADPDAGSEQLVRSIEAGGHPGWKLVLAGPSADGQRWLEALGRAGVALDRLRAVSSTAGTAAAFTAAAESSDADCVLFLETPLSARSDDWLRTLIGLANLDGVAAVGAKVLAEDGRVEHAGIVIGEGLPLPVCHGAGSEDVGYMSALQTTANRSAVSGAVMAPLGALLAVGGLDRALGGLALVDYCLRAADVGLRTIWTPDTLLSRDGSAPPINDLAALHTFRERWRGRIEVDPFYSPAFWQERADFTILDGA